MTELVFTFKHSRILLIGLSVLHVLAMIAALCNTLHVAIQTALSVFIALHFVWYWRRYDPRIDLGQLTYSETTGWTRGIGGRFQAIEILPSSILTTFLIIVHFRRLDFHDSPSTLVCFKDALTPAAFRQLTVQLKISGVLVKKQSPDINT